MVQRTTLTDSEDQQSIFYTVAAVAKLGLMPINRRLFSLFIHDARTGPSLARPGGCCQPLGQKCINGLRHRSDRPVPPALRHEMFEVALVRDVAQLDQD